MSGKEGDVARRGRGDRLIQEYIHDPYMMRSKPVDPTVCPRCNVVFSEGRWQWLPEMPEGAHTHLCPACQRIEDKVPAGYLTLSGDFFTQHREEIINLVHNKVNSKKTQHPLQRLIDIEDQEDNSVLITFTDMHLPRGVGEAIARAYEGDLDIQYTDQAGMLRVYWRR